MHALIVAGVAGLAGVAGVVGLTQATVDSGPADSPPPALVSTGAEAPSALNQRLANLRRAERAADAALRKAASRSTERRAATTPVVTYTAAPRATSAVSGDHEEYGGDDHGYDDHDDDGAYHEQDD